MYRNVTKSWNWDYRLRACSTHGTCTHTHTPHRTAKKQTATIIPALGHLHPLRAIFSVAFRSTFITVSFFCAPVSCLCHTLSSSPIPLSSSVCLCVVAVGFFLFCFTSIFHLERARICGVLVHFNDTRTIALRFVWFDLSDCALRKSFVQCYRREICVYHG